MRAHIYCRVSTEEQVDGYSLHAQERACRLYCEMHDHQVADIYIDEGWSGTIAERPQFARLNVRVQPGDLVVVHKLDRFARSTSILLETLERWAKSNIRLISVHEQIDFSTPMGKVMLTMLGAFGQYYVDNLRHETTKGLREKARRGGWIGPVPFGYVRVDGRLEIDEEAAAIVREIFRLYVDDSLSYGAIAQQLNDDNQRSPIGRGWGRENVRVILRNPAYIGQTSGGLPGNHHALIRQEMFDAAAQRRAANTHAPIVGRPRARYDMLYCGHCDQRLWFWYKSGNTPSTTSYRCHGCRSGNIGHIVENRIGDLLSTMGQEEEALHAVWLISGEVVAVAVEPRLERLVYALGLTTRPKPKK